MKRRIGSAMVAVVIAAMCAMAAVQTAKAAQDFSGVVNVNTATAEQLMEVPGIGPAKADAILSYRATNPFDSVEELKEVKGIGDKLLAKISPYLTVDGKKPGSGAKMRK